MKDKEIIKAQFLQHVRKELDAKKKHNRKSIERIALSYGIADKSEVKEYTELAIVLKARSISLSSLSIEDKYWSIVELYESQVNISHRTSQSESSPYLVAFEIKEFHDKLSSCWNVVNSTPLKGWWSFPYFNRNCVGV